MNYDDKLDMSEDVERYEYSLLKYIHDLSGGEFVYIGILLFNRDSKNIYFNINDRYGRISRFFRDFDGRKYSSLISGIKKSLTHLATTYNRELFNPDYTDAEDILEDISRNPQSCFEWTSPRGGIDKDPRSRLDDLYYEFVTFHEKRDRRNRVDESNLRRAINEIIMSANMLDLIDTGYSISTPNISYDFSAAWRNGKTQVLEPVSFDFTRPADIEKKATQWRGTIDALSRQEEFEFSALVAPPSVDDINVEDQLKDAFEKAVGILEELSTVRKILQKDELDNFIRTIRQEAS